MRRFCLGLLGLLLALGCAPTYLHTNPNAKIEKSIIACYGRLAPRSDLLGRKRIFIAAIAIAALLVAGELLGGRLGLESQRRTIERELSDAIGLAVSIGGNLRLHLLPTPRFEAEDVRVANLPGRPWTTRGTSCRSFRVAVSSAMAA